MIIRLSKLIIESQIAIKSAPPKGIITRNIIIIIITIINS